MQLVTTEKWAENCFESYERLNCFQSNELESEIPVKIFCMHRQTRLPA